MAAASASVAGAVVNGGALPVAAGGGERRVIGRTGVRWP